MKRRTPKYKVVDDFNGAVYSRHHKIENAEAAVAKLGREREKTPGMQNCYNTFAVVPGSAVWHEHPGQWLAKDETGEWEEVSRRW